MYMHIYTYVCVCGFIYVYTLHYSKVINVSCKLSLSTMLFMGDCSKQQERTKVFARAQLHRMILLFSCSANCHEISHCFRKT